MKNIRTEKEIESIRLEISNILQKTNGEIDFENIKEEILLSNRIDFDKPITEEELEELFNRYDKTLFKGAYKRYLTTVQLQGNMLGVEILKIYKGTMLNYIKKLIIKDENGELNKFRTKKRVKEIIQNSISSEESKLSRELGKMLENFDFIFNIVWQEYSAKEEQGKITDFMSLVREVMKKIPPEYRKEKMYAHQRRRSEGPIRCITMTRGILNGRQEYTNNEYGMRRKPRGKFKQELKVIPTNRPVKEKMLMDEEIAFEENIQGEEK